MDLGLGIRVAFRANNADIMRASVRSRHIRAADVVDSAEVAKIVEIATQTIAQSAMPECR
jgi:hypothetical protein